MLVRRVFVLVIYVWMVCDIKPTATYFPRVKTQVSSADMCLTIVFGMGTGVSTYHKPSA